MLYAAERWAGTCRHAAAAAASAIPDATLLPFCNLCGHCKWSLAAFTNRCCVMSNRAVHLPDASAVLWALSKGAARPQGLGYRGVHEVGVQGTACVVKPVASQNRGVQWCWAQCAGWDVCGMLQRLLPICSLPAVGRPAAAAAGSGGVLPSQ